MTSTLPHRFLPTVLVLLLAACGGGDSPNEPRVATLPATEVSATGATLNLSVNPRGEPTEVIFFWGGNSSLDLDYAADFGAVGRDSVRVSMPITGLAPDTNYYFRARASNDHHLQADGVIRRFTTAADASPYWARSWGAEGHNDELNAVHFAADGGYLLAGKLATGIGSEMWVVRFDADDRLEWRATYASIGLFEANAIAENSDGSLFVAGTGPDPLLDTNLVEPYPVLVKLNSRGELLWARRYSQFGSFTAVFATPDQGAMLFGDLILDLPAGGIEIDIGVYKVDRDGEVEWVRQIDSGEYDFLTSVKPTAGGYAAVGKSLPIPFVFNTPVPPWSFEIDATGNLLWQKLYACLLSPEEIHVLDDDGLLVAGEIDDDGALLWLDADGDFEFMRVYAGDDLQSLDVDTGGNIIATGCFETGPGCGIGIARFDDLGEPDWARTYAFTRRDGKPSDGGTRRIRYKSDGNLLFAGRYETRYDDLDAQIMLLPPDGDLGDADRAHSLEDSPGLCFDTGTASMTSSNATADALPLQLLARFERATAFQQISVP